MQLIFNAVYFWNDMDALEISDYFLNLFHEQ